MASSTTALSLSEPWERGRGGGSRRPASEPGGLLEDSLAPHRRGPRTHVEEGDEASLALGLKEGRVAEVEDADVLLAAREQRLHQVAAKQAMAARLRRTQGRAGRRV